MSSTPPSLITADSHLIQRLTTWLGFVASLAGLSGIFAGVAFIAGQSYVGAKYTVLKFFLLPPSITPSDYILFGALNQPFTFVFFGALLVTLAACTVALESVSSWVMDKTRVTYQKQNDSGKRWIHGIIWGILGLAWLGCVILLILSWQDRFIVLKPWRAILIAVSMSPFFFIILDRSPRLQAIVARRKPWFVLGYKICFLSIGLIVVLQAEMEYAASRGRIAGETLLGKEPVPVKVLAITPQLLDTARVTTTLVGESYLITYEDVYLLGAEDGLYFIIRDFTTDCQPSSITPLRGDQVEVVIVSPPVSSLHPCVQLPQPPSAPATPTPSPLPAPSPTP